MQTAGTPAQMPGLQPTTSDAMPAAPQQQQVPRAAQQSSAVPIDMQQVPTATMRQQQSRMISPQQAVVADTTKHDVAQVIKSYRKFRQTAQVAREQVQQTFAQTVHAAEQQRIAQLRQFIQSQP